MTSVVYSVLRPLGSNGLIDLEVKFIALVKLSGSQNNNRNSNVRKRFVWKKDRRQGWEGDKKDWEVMVITMYYIHV